MTTFPPPAVLPAEPQQTNRLYRAQHGRVLGGVAGGLADHLGLPRKLVRLAFVLLSFSAGLGVLLYGAFWIVLQTRSEDGKEGSARSAVQYLVAAVAAAGVLLVNAHTLPLGWWFTPSLLACFGGALLWRQASETDRERWRRLSSSSLAAGAADRIGWLRIIAGVTLVLTGAVFILARAGITAAGAALAAVLVTAGGLALITGPWWLKLMRDLSTERRERIRNEERADIAAHLHDSVLQTLALIQRNASQPREVARLARRQERELRTKLYGTGVPTGRFAAALQATAAEVEDTYAVTVDVVVVGDHTLDARLDALVAASREALVNAAKHAQVTTVSVYAELTGDSASVFVRDRGAGFDPDRISESRQGIRGSIVGRLQRQHGTATIRSAPGQGTEVQLRVELD
ncbi:PspC domain-containing protein [Jatrophihabitans sp.]|uniref:ATP-binding protein n=1 Tax=Jatrophihabitans sp. TaxID=1932789 RepID=UPI002BF20F92|nr:PspC domain-containing protein [Jatrophihabitans sp.]